jgi:hypothetical protein
MNRKFAAALLILPLTFSAVSLTSAQAPAARPVQPVTPQKTAPPALLPPETRHFKEIWQSAREKAEAKDHVGAVIEANAATRAYIAAFRKQNPGREFPTFKEHVAVFGERVDFFNHKHVVEGIKALKKANKKATPEEIKLNLKQIDLLLRNDARGWSEQVVRATLAEAEYPYENYYADCLNNGLEEIVAPPQASNLNNGPNDPAIA